MLSYLLSASKGTLLLGLRLLRAVPAEGWQHSWKRLPLFAVLWLACVALNLAHLLGFLIDEIVFHDYRQVRVRRPVFILGIPRSGTTFLHRVLAADTAFATLSTWEVLFAPSITERYCYRFLGGLLAPLGVVLRWLRVRLLGRMDSIHAIRLQEPEEDFLLLFWIQACFLLAFVCPGSDHYWRLADFDAAFSTRDKERILAFYRRCLQKHLFYHGSDKRILSKNPSFTPFIQSLDASFEDARFIACVRPPQEAVPSQLSALRPAQALLGGGRLAPPVQQGLIAVLHRYYQILAAPAGPRRQQVVSMRDLRRDLYGCVEALYGFLGQDMNSAFRRELEQLQLQARQYRSRHRYEAAEFSLTEATIGARFADVWPPPGLTRTELV